MKLTTHLFSPNNTGAPNYNICGQASSVVSFVNTSFKVSISNGTTTQVLVDTANLNGVVTPNTGTYTFGDLDISFTAFAKNAGTGSLTFDMNFYKTGTTDPYTWTKLFLVIEVSKAGYQSYLNTFEIYGYDIGNDVTLGYTGNPGFDIYLINNTNNINANGNQTKAFSSFSYLRQPFTDNIFIYNMVGTQGNITYYDSVSGLEIGNGKSTKVCVLPDLCNNNGISVKEKIQVYDGNTLLDTCEITIAVPPVIWLPKVSNVSSCPDACNDCVNNISQLTIQTTIDYENVTPFKLNNTLVFLSQFMSEGTTYQLIDFQGALIDSIVTPYTITYAAWIINKAPFLVPIEFVITTPPLGDTKVIITHFLENLILCNETLIFKVCNWWTVTKGTTCGDYVFNNCSNTDISIVLQKFNNDKTFTDISTLLVLAYTNTTISLQADGVYMVKVPSRDVVGDYDYYSIVSYCLVEECWLAYLDKVMCCKVTDDCAANDNYKYTAFLITVQSFFMALNEEFNFSFIYSLIDADKLETLYMLDSYITRLAEYCEADGSCSPCKTC